MAGTTKNFEELHVFQKSRALVREIYQMTRQEPFACDLSLCDQVRRASVSIVSNIAEGYERGTNAELIQYLYIAKGSCGEVRAQLMIACDLDYIKLPNLERLTDQARRISAMLANLIRHVRTSGYKQRTAQAKPAQSDFQKMIENYIPPLLRSQKAQQAESPTDT